MSKSRFAGTILMLFAGCTEGYKLGELPETEIEASTEPSRDSNNKGDESPTDSTSEPSGTESNGSDDSDSSSNESGLGEQDQDAVHCQELCDATNTCDGVTDTSCAADCVELYASLRSDRSAECVASLLAVDACVIDASLSGDCASQYTCVRDEYRYLVECEELPLCTPYPTGESRTNDDCRVDFEVDCEMEVTPRSIECTDEECSCFDGEELVGTCPGENYCSNFGNAIVFDLAARCCGWTTLDGF